MSRWWKGNVYIYIHILIAVKDRAKPAISGDKFTVGRECDKQSSCPRPCH